LSLRYGATLLTRRHPASGRHPRPPWWFRWREYNRRPSFCRRGTSCMEQSFSIRHWLHIFWQI